jgi:hypothetical protein
MKKIFTLTLALSFIVSMAQTDYHFPEESSKHERNMAAMATSLSARNDVS